MKIFLFILTFVSLMKFTSAQTWAPIGAKWTYGVSYAMGPTQIQYREWVSTTDTFVGGHICKLIKRNGSEVAGDISNELITYEDSNKVYLYNINQFTVLYDFNKNAGETWSIMNDTCSLIITVDSTGIDTINGFALKALYVSSEDMAFSGKILEHIGHLFQPNPFFDYHCFGIISDTNFYTGLRCYEDNIIGFHSFGIAPSCDYTVTGIENIENGKFEIALFPNPATNELNIKSHYNQEFNFRIYNSIGQIVLIGILKSDLSTINLNNILNGIYNIECLNGDRIERHSFIIRK